MIPSLMAARAIGTATVSFGLVSIPVNIYSASQSSSDVSFNLLHKDCGARVKQQYVCSKDGAAVPREEMVKGYEYAKGQYVLFSADELKALEEKATQTVDITEFVPAEKIDPVWFDKAYYLGPDKGGDRAYRLLAKAMEETKRVGARQVRRARKAVPRPRAARRRRRARHAAAPLRRRGPLLRRGGRSRRRGARTPSSSSPSSSPSRWPRRPSTPSGTRTRRRSGSSS